MSDVQSAVGEIKALDKELQKIMGNIHETCLKYGEDSGRVNYVKGANIGGFVKMSEAMLAYGIN